ncbi:TPA: hypothetical protein ACMU21_002958 [Clostridioides difficile]|uniref:hypothetical protein n=1 Tax=Clostridioides difficile TaxID=1496 RepID=UPI00093F28F7|nr:hypothetical protein [Clostridioides difficile]EGT3685962.1 hypothetical protein [Clostridioides difficile]EGT4521476.1 hypothetical protein [Clostridioides difficile]EGT4537070.1 hypothetical protein [Clostridioides difficile]EGT4563511.1 hypothetical protein [Clostridioides difficile]EII6784120.1 hypothetical protein [Clostridioides difficile]
MSKNLINYMSEKVKIIDIDNKEWIGYVKTYTPAIDSDNEINEIGLKQEDCLISFQEDEIKSIEII